MIWFFLTGWIAGVIGTVMFAKWWMHTHVKRVTPEEAMRDLKNMEEEKEDND